MQDALSSRGGPRSGIAGDGPAEFGRPVLLAIGRPDVDSGDFRLNPGIRGGNISFRRRLPVGHRKVIEKSKQVTLRVDNRHSSPACDFTRKHYALLALVALTAFCAFPEVPEEEPALVTGADVRFFTAHSLACTATACFALAVSRFFSAADLRLEAADRLVFTGPQDMISPLDST